METAYHIFKNHPNFGQMKVIIEPLIREKIMIGSDLPSFDSKKTIQAEYLSIFPNMDTSKLDPLCESLTEPWYFKTLNPEFRAKFQDENSLLDHMEDTFPQNQEGVMNAKRRADQFKKEIFEYSSKNPSEKIAVISHSMFMKVLTSKDEYWEKILDINDPKMPEGDYSHLMMNCEFQPLY